MSKNYSDCDIVLELLPLYLDGKTCEESNDFVKEHLAGCSECREVQKLMDADFSQEKETETGSAEKRRKGKWKRTMILVSGLVGYFLLMVGVVAYAIWLLARV